VSRVLVTGATGFVGRHALQPLLEAGYDVHAVSSAPAASPATDGVTWHRADLLGDPAGVVRDVRPQRLLHLAWYAEHGRFWTSLENLRWVEATLALVRAFAAAGGERAVCAGTCAEYDWTTGAATLAEDAPLRPATLYGTAKHATHQMLDAAAPELGIALAWGRVFFLYGPGEDERRLVGSVASALTRGQRALTGDGSQIRDVMYVADAGAAFAALVGADVRGPVNVASGEAQTLRGVVEATGRLVGRPDLLDIGALLTRPGDPDALVADVTRLRDEVGFRPRVALEDGLAATVEWWRAQPPTS